MIRPLLFLVFISTLPLWLHPLISAKPPASWQKIGTSTLPREGVTTIAIGDSLYFFGGYINQQFDVTPRAERYDIATKSWHKLADMPFAVTHLGVAKLGDDLWLNGGLEGTFPGIPLNTIQIYHIKEDRWSLGPALPQPAISAGLAYVNGMLHSFGGTQADNQTNSTAHYILDPKAKNPSWQKLNTEVPQPRTHSSTVVLDDQIYLIGGEFGHRIASEDTSMLHRFDPKTQHWQRLADLPMDASHHDNSAFAYQNKIYVLGGKSYRQLAIDNIISYDPATNQWEQKITLPARLIAASARPVGDRLIAAFGGKESYKHLYDGIWQLPIATLTGQTTP